MCGYTAELANHPNLARDVLPFPLARAHLDDESVNSFVVFFTLLSLFFSRCSSADSDPGGTVTALLVGIAQPSNPTKGIVSAIFSAGLVASVVGGGNANACSNGLAEGVKSEFRR